MLGASMLMMPTQMTLKWRKFKIFKHEFDPKTFGSRDESLHRPESELLDGIWNRQPVFFCLLSRNRNRNKRAPDHADFGQQHERIPDEVHFDVTHHVN